MQAVILAAGRGTRLGLDRRPKCLVEIDGRPLIRHQLDVLGEAGVREVTVVIGFEAAQVRDALASDATTVLNRDYVTTNSLYSFLLARDRVGCGELLVLNCDVLFERSLLDRLLEAPGSAVTFDSGSDGGDEEMKVCVRDGRVVRMSKAMAPSLCCGENVGVLRLDATAAGDAFRAARQIVEAGRRNDWLASAINRVARAHELHAVDVAGLPWVEIDFPGDLGRAREAVLPAIREAATLAAA